MGEGCLGQAKASFQLALRVAREQRARSLELRAGISLARLWLAEGKPGEARGLLAPIHAWFTEGHGTPDYKAAGALPASL